MSNSVIKFMGRTGADGEKLSWGRADLDGAPFRGQIPQNLTNDEAEERLVKTQTPFNRKFDLSVPEDNKAYLYVLDKAANGWATIAHLKRVTIRVRRKLDDGTVYRDVIFKVYVEWFEAYMQDGKPMQSQRPYAGRPNDD